MLPLQERDICGGIKTMLQSGMSLKQGEKEGLEKY